MGPSTETECMEPVSHVLPMIPFGAQRAQTVLVQADETKPSSVERKEQIGTGKRRLGLGIDEGNGWGNWLGWSIA